MTTSEKMSAGIKKAAVPAALALTAIAAGGYEAAKAAAEQEAASDRLAHQLERTTGATKDQVDAAEQYVLHLSLATGVARDQLEPALGRLATATHSVSDAQKDLSLATDISAQTGKSLQAVSTALAKGYSGNVGAISRLVPGLDAAVLKTKDMTAVTAELADITGGAASEAADTAAGRYAIMQNQMHELTVSIGEGLLPIIQALLPVLQSATNFMTEHTTAVKIAIVAIAALAAGILAANVALKAYEAAQIIVTAATKAWTAAQWLLDAALDANPISLLVLALAAVGAALVLAYTRSATFRGIVADALDAVATAGRALERAFDAVLAAATSAFDWIVAHWQIGLLALGPIGVAIDLLATHFDALKKVAIDVFDSIVSAIEAVAGAIDSAFSDVQRLIDAIGSIHIPHIPGLDAVIPAPPALGRSASSGSSTRESTGSPINVNVYGAIDPEGTARTILQVLQGRQPPPGTAGAGPLTCGSPP